MFGLIGAGISAISGGLSAVGSAVSSVCSLVGGPVLSTGRIMIEAISRGLPVAIQVCDIAFTVGKALGFFGPEQNEVDMYELGMRTEHAVEEGITSDQFESNQAYIDYLREKITLSKDSIEKLDELSTSDKLKYASIGSAMTIAAIKEKYNIDIPESFWLTGAELGIEPQQFKPLLDIFERAELKPDLKGFQKGELSSDLQSKIYDLIESSLDDILSKETVNKLLS